MWSRLSQLLRTSPSRNPSIRNSLRSVSSNTIKALEFIGKGYNAIHEVDRVIDYTDPDDERLQPLLKAAKENFEMALEMDNKNTHAMVWLGRLHLNYHIPGACTDIGAALLTEAAETGNPDAQYELACQLRGEDGLVDAEDKSFYWLESAACQLHPKALFLMGCIYLTGEHTNRDLKAAAWCFCKAAELGHAAAATVYGALIAKGIIEKSQSEDVDINESTLGDSFETSQESCTQELEEGKEEIVRRHFEMAAEAGDELALEWLKRLPTNTEGSEAW